MGRGESERERAGDFGSWGGDKKRVGSEWRRGRKMLNRRGVQSVTVAL